MNRTIVCKKCDNNRVTIDKIGPELYIKCSKCGNIIMQKVHLESWDRSVTNTYKLGMNIEDSRLIEADIIETEFNKKEFQTLSIKERTIWLIYVKEYEYLRQIEEDEYREISKLIAREYRKFPHVLCYNEMWHNIFIYREERYLW